jgi:hypothetical protein
VREGLDVSRLTGRQVSVAAVVASFFYSAIHIFLDPLPNPDAVTYLLAAQAWLDDGYAAAAAVYPRPYYSILIAAVHTLTGFSLLTSAHWLDATLIAALVVALQRLGRALGGGVRVEIIVVVFALLLPELNGYRSFVLRDFGYWTFLVVALTCLVRYIRAPNFFRLAAFMLCCLAAALFRVEAIPILVLMPLALLFGAPKRLGAVAALYGLVVIGVVAAQQAASIGSASATSDSGVEATLHSAMVLLTELPLHLRAQLAGFATTVLDPRFPDYAAFGLAGAVAALIVVHVAIASSLPLFAVAVIGVARKAYGRLDRRALPIVWMALAIALLGLAAVLLSRGIIQTRYAMPAGLLILVVAAFVIDAWYTAARTPQTRARLRRAGVLLLVYFVGEAGFDLFNSKQHFLAAADWLAQHTPRDARIYANDLRVIYLADRRVRWQEPHELRASALPTAGYDYWAVLVERDDTGLRRSIEDAPGWQQMAQFINRKGDAVLILSSASTP